MSMQIIFLFVANPASQMPKSVFVLNCLINTHLKGSLFLSDEPFHGLGQPARRIGKMTAGIHFQHGRNYMLILLQTFGLQLCFVLNG